MFLMVIHTDDENNDDVYCLFRIAFVCVCVFLRWILDLIRTQLFLVRSQEMFSFLLLSIESLIFAIRSVTISTIADMTSDICRRLVWKLSSIHTKKTHQHALVTLRGNSLLLLLFRSSSLSLYLYILYTYCLIIRQFPFVWLFNMHISIDIRMNTEHFFFFSSERFFFPGHLLQVIGQKSYEDTVEEEEENERWWIKQQKKFDPGCINRSRKKKKNLIPISSLYPEG